MGSHKFRQRYWARSMLGFPRLQKAEPNQSHFAIEQLLSNRSANNNLITQNVDSLHLKAGSKGAVEMHGALRKVICQSCSQKFDREEFQNSLYDLNPFLFEWIQEHSKKVSVDVASSVNPDGDVEISWNYDQIQYPSCFTCRSGILKPDVVFFGENMLDSIRQETFKMVDKSDILLIIGSSLQVFSSFRLAKRAKENGIPLAIINLGMTRADQMADAKIDYECSFVLNKLLT